MANENSGNGQTVAPAVSSSRSSGGKTTKRAVPMLIAVGTLGALMAFINFYGTSMTSRRTQSQSSFFRGSTVAKYGNSLGYGDAGINHVPPIEELTKSHIQDGIECPYPLVPFYDRIVEASGNSRIPKAIHLAWVRGYSSPNGQGRCISQDMMEIPNKWMEHFPSYNIYFHDDDAVDALFAQEWPEFPALYKIMEACVKFGSAMRIDIWRQLILYRYGGMYGDFDMMPAKLLTEETVAPTDSAVFLSDGWNRPSQWFMAMAPKHPIAYFTVIEIMKRLTELKDVSSIKVVFTTGPDLLKHGYWNALVTTEDYDTVYNHGLHNSTLIEGPIRKLPGKDYAGGYDDTLVPYPRNHTTDDDYVNIKKKDRVHKEMSTMHWKTLMQETKHEKPNGACQHYLYWHDWNATQVMEKGYDKVSAVMNSVV